MLRLSKRIERWLWNVNSAALAVVFVVAAGWLGIWPDACEPTTGPDRTLQAAPLEPDDETWDFAKNFFVVAGSPAWEKAAGMTANHGHFGNSYIDC
jgi:hypothetical protein